jgi:hypothetical protein
MNTNTNSIVILFCTDCFALDLSSFEKTLPVLGTCFLIQDVAATTCNEQQTGIRLLLSAGQITSTF